MEEEIEEEEKVLILNEDGLEQEEEYCKGNCDATSLVTQRVTSVQEDEQLLKTQYFQNLLCFSRKKVSSSGGFRKL